MYNLIVAVVRNSLDLLTKYLVSAVIRTDESTTRILNLRGFFYLYLAIVLHTIAEHLNGWLGSKHRTSIHPDAKCDRTWFRYR